MQLAFSTLHQGIDLKFRSFNLCVTQMGILCLPDPTSIQAEKPTLIWVARPISPPATLKGGCHHCFVNMIHSASCGFPPYYPLPVSGSAPGPQDPSPPLNLIGIRVSCAPVHDLYSAVHLASVIMVSADDAFIISGYSHVSKLLKAAKEQLATVTSVAHRH